jgi:hypothetical protein
MSPLPTTYKDVLNHSSLVMYIYNIGNLFNEIKQLKNINKAVMKNN